MSIIDLTTSLVYATVSAAIAASGTGDTIALTPGLYVEDFPLITHSLTIEGVGGLAHLETPDPTPANQRAILYVAGDAGADLTIDIPDGGEANRAYPAPACWCRTTC